MGFRFCSGEGAIHRWRRGLGAACLSACHFSCRVVVSGGEAAAQKGTREDSYMRWEGRGSLLTVVLVWALAG